MTTIAPSLPPAPTASGPQAPVTATPVSDVPAQIASLPPNSTIDATVAAAQNATQAVAQATAQAAAQARAVVQLMTSLGNLTVRLPMPVPPNATLRLQVLGSGATLQLRVIAINGQALPGAGLAPTVGEVGPQALPPLAGPLTGSAANASAAQMPPQPGGLTAGSAAAGETLPSPAPGSGLPATIVFGTEDALPNGTQLTVRLLDIVPPGAGLGLPQTGPGATAPLFPQPPVTPLSGQPPIAGALPLPGAIPAPPAGALPIVTPLPEAPSGLPTAGPGIPASTPPSPGILIPPSADAASALPETLPGVVALNSLAGRPLIQTPIGLITLDAGPDLLPGSQLTLQTVGAPMLPPPAAAAPNTDQPQQQTGWNTFGEAMAALQKADPAVAQLLVQRLPDLGPQFVPNLVSWMAAAQSGDMRAWLGERTVKALEKAGRGDLIGKLDDDMSGMRVPVRLPQMGDDWQALTLPLFFGQRVERVRITMRQPKGEDTGVAGIDEEGLRFLVDVDMSRLGALQLDGLVKRHAKHFELIVRSHMELPETVRRDINGIFTRSLEGLGMTGGAVFKQAVAFVEPLPTDINHAGVTA